jgi:tRNA (guanine37-N1)-methyltransferase
MSFHFQVVTLFPELVHPYLAGSILGRAIKKGLIEVTTLNPREFTTDKHRTVDDDPYGGGAGMVMKAEPLALAVEAGRAKAPDAKVVLMSPCGQPFDQGVAKRLSGLGALILVCGRYEGIDQRLADHCVDEEISLGDFVLTGGELAALSVIDATSRLLEGVLGHAEGAIEESFTDKPLLEHPQYTRPRTWRGHEVPEVLLSGDHAKIEAWRLAKRVELTQARRPDLLDDGEPIAEKGA